MKERKKERKKKTNEQTNKQTNKHDKNIISLPEVKAATAVNVFQVHD